MAKCVSCGAPLPDNKVTCVYCGTRNDIDLQGIDYNTTHESDEQRICPRCDIPLKTIDLKIGGHFYIEKCDECHGMFFDNGELEEVLKNKVKDGGIVKRKLLNSLRELDSKSIDVIAKKQYIKCPVCNKLMNRQSYAFKSGVVLNSCKDHGLWLDNGQLKTLFEWKKLGGETLAKEQGDRLEKQKTKEKERKNKELAIEKELDSDIHNSSYKNHRYGSSHSIGKDIVSMLFDLF